MHHFNETETQWTDWGPWAFYFPLLYICLLCDEVLLPKYLVTLSSMWGPWVNMVKKEGFSQDVVACDRLLDSV